MNNKKILQYVLVPGFSQDSPGTIIHNSSCKDLLKCYKYEHFLMRRFVNYVDICFHDFNINDNIKLYQLSDLIGKNIKSKDLIYIVCTCHKNGLQFSFNEINFDIHKKFSNLEIYFTQFLGIPFLGYNEDKTINSFNYIELNLFNILNEIQHSIFLDAFNEIAIEFIKELMDYD